MERKKHRKIITAFCNFVLMSISMVVFGGDVSAVCATAGGILLLVTVGTR